MSLKRQLAGSLSLGAAQLLLVGGLALLLGGRAGVLPYLQVEPAGWEETRQIWARNSLQLALMLLLGMGVRAAWARRDLFGYLWLGAAGGIIFLQTLTLAQSAADLGVGLKASPLLVLLGTLPHSLLELAVLCSPLFFLPSRRAILLCLLLLGLLAGVEAHLSPALQQSLTPLQDPSRPLLMPLP